MKAILKKQRMTGDVLDKLRKIIQIWIFNLQGVCMRIVLTVEIKMKLILLTNNFHRNEFNMVGQEDGTHLRVERLVIIQLVIMILRLFKRFKLIIYE